MAQWVNRLRNKIFVNTPPLPLLCEISGALHLAQPDLTAGWLAVRREGSPTKRLRVRDFKYLSYFKISFVFHFK